MRYLRDLGRRPVRTTLTILGITIGIWSLVVFGSMANKIAPSWRVAATTTPTSSR